jgi:hypothetical protein
MVMRVMKVRRESEGESVGRRHEEMQEGDVREKGRRMRRGCDEVRRCDT